MNGQEYRIRTSAFPTSSLPMTFLPPIFLPRLFVLRMPMLIQHGFPGMESFMVRVSTAKMIM